MSRIGLFTYSTRPRGSVVHAACLAEALTRAKHDVTLFALNRGEQGFFRELSCDVRLFPAAEAPADLDALIEQRIGEFLRGLEAANPELDLLHAQDCLAANALLRARSSNRLASARRLLVRTVHHVERFESEYLLACQRRSILEADLLLSVSETTRQAVRAEFGRESELVSNGVDCEHFVPLPAAQRDAVRAGLGLAPEDFVVLSVGGVEARKNSQRCLAAFAALREQQPRALWVVVGGASILDHREFQGRFEAELARLAPATRQRIRRPGCVSDAELRRWYQASDTLLCPSEQEGWGLCVLEAMASELPVIVSRRPPFTEYVSEQAGLLVEPEDTPAIAHAIACLAADPRRCAQLGRAGRRSAERFSWSRSAALHAEAYERARGALVLGPPHAA
jgi:glycosyltransferase-like protein